MEKISFCLGIECFDSCFWISSLVIPFITFFVIRLFRPKLKIDNLIIMKEEGYLKFSVSNESRLFDVNNLRIEVCVFNPEESFTYHFKPDHTEFLILPSKGFFGKKIKSKKFVCRQAAESAMIILRKDEYNENLTKEEGFSRLIEKTNFGYKIRVRCHAYDSFSGLGKSFEKIFN